MRIVLIFALAAASLHAQESLRLDLGGGQSMELVRIQPGSFTQGSPAAEAGRAADENEHAVTLSQAYFIGKYPVTRGQFARFAEAANFRTEAERGPSGGFGWESGKLVQKHEYTWRNPGFAQTEDHPVVLVTYADATAFCTWASQQTGWQVTLPSEAQWEFAARGGGQAGEGWNATNSPGGTQPVGKKPANGFGLHDMLGNAWEWCEDWYAPYTAGPITDPRQTNPNLSDKPRRVLRGGAFSRPASEARPANRFRNDPGSRNADNGFRVVVLDAAVAPPKSTSPPPPPPGQALHEKARPMPQPHDEPVSAPLSTPLPSSAEDFDTAPSSGSGPSFVQWGVIGVVVLFVLAVVRKILRGSGSSSPYLSQTPVSGSMLGATTAFRQGQRFQTGPFQIRTVADGFWILGNVQPGTLLQAMWSGSTTSHTRSFDYQPGPDGHFVFTGEPPAQVGVTISGDQPLGSMLDDPLIPRPVPPIHHTPPPPAQNFGGYPSAY